MYLKEAFRYQNFLNGMIDKTLGYLSLNRFTTMTVQHHLRSKVNPEAEDETIDLSSEREIEYTADQMIAFLEYILCRKQVLTEAISKAKKDCEIDIDAEIANNRVRQRVSATLSRIGNIRPSERISRGYAYKFNAEGNQVQYTYDVKEVTTIDFNRNAVKRLSKSLIGLADDTSTAIDKAMVELMVKYEPEFSVNDSFNDVMELFLAHAETNDK